MGVVKRSFNCCMKDCSQTFDGEELRINRLCILAVQELIRIRENTACSLDRSIPREHALGDYKFDNQVGGSREISNQVVVGSIGLALATLDDFVGGTYYPSAIRAVKSYLCLKLKGINKA